MKIGNGILEIGICGINNGKYISVSKIEKIAKDVLNYYPLNKIFKVTHIEIENKLTNFEKLKNKLDVVGVVGWHINSRYEDGFVYSEPDSTILAHEIGHALGLKHPAQCKIRGYCSEKFMKEHCPDSKYIMGCVIISGKNDGFSQEDKDKLEKWYLR